MSNIANYCASHIEIENNYFNSKEVELTTTRLQSSIWMDGMNFIQTMPSLNDALDYYKDLSNVITEDQQRLTLNEIQRIWE